MPRNKRGISMVRVSTKEQKEFGYSIPTQLEGCRKYAATHAIEIVDELVDSCTGETPIAERPEGRKLYDYVSSKKIDAVILYTLDRTARDDKVLEYLLLKSYLQEYGVELHYTDTGLDPFTMEANLVGYIKSHAATTEKKKIRERSMRGKNGKAQDGKVVAGGITPYGYIKVGKGKASIYERNEEQLHIVKLIFEWYVFGDDNGEPSSERKILDKLRVMGAPSPWSGAWTRDGVRNILQNEIYAGVYHYGQTRMVNGKREKMPLEEHILVNKPELAVITKSVFEMAQDRREKNKVSNPRNSRLEYLLRGHLHCGYDGHSMVGTSLNMKLDGTRNRRYRCAKHWNRGELELCPNSNSPTGAIKLETTAWNWVKELCDEKKIRMAIKHLQESDADNKNTKRDRYDRIGKMIADDERALRKLANRFALEEEDSPIASALDEQMRMYSTRITNYKEEMLKLDYELRSESFSHNEVERLVGLMKMVAQRVAVANFAQKRQILDFFNVQAEVTIDENKLRHLNIKAYLKKDVLFDEVAFILPDGRTGLSSAGGDNDDYPVIKVGTSWNTHLKYAMNLVFSANILLDFTRFGKETVPTVLNSSVDIALV